MSDDDELRLVEIEALDPPQDVRIAAEAPRTIVRLQAPPAPPPPPAQELRILSFLGRPAAGGALEREVHTAADEKAVLVWQVQGADEVTLVKRAKAGPRVVVGSRLALTGKLEAVSGADDVTYTLETRQGNTTRELADVHVVAGQEGPVRVRLIGTLFESDKTFLLPRALKSLEELGRIFDEHAPKTLLVNGHTDSAGKRDYNQGLSTERATALRAFFKGDAADWLGRYAARPHGQPWGVREDKHMLAHLKHHDGPIDGSANARYAAGVKSFREAKGLGGGGGPMDAATRRALVQAYMAQRALPAQTNIVVHGCGELHPAKDVGDEVADAENRRVELFLFPGEARPAPPAACGTRPPGCAEYAAWVASLAKTIDLRDELASFEVIVVDELGAPVAGADVTLDGPGAHRGRTDAEGRLLRPAQLAGAYQVTVTKQGHAEATTSAEAPGVVEVVLVRVALGVTRSLPGAVFLGRTSCPGPGLLEHLRWLYREADLTAERRVRVLGHAAEGGDAAGNKRLTDSRARVVMALLARDVAVLDQVAAEERWGVQCYQSMLRALGCNPGKLDGVAGQATQAAARAFQRAYGEDVYHRGTGAARAVADLPADGQLSPATQVALRDAYVVAAAGDAPLPRECFVGQGFSGCGDFNGRAADDPDGCVELAVYVEPPPATFPCTAGDAAACQLDRDGAPRCRFYRETLIDADSEARDRFFDLRWSLEPDGRTVRLSALTLLREGTPVTFTVYRHEQPLPQRRAPTSWNTPGRFTPGPVLATLAGTVQGGVAWAEWTPPAGHDPFHWPAWYVDDQARPGTNPFQPPVFVVEGAGQWACSRPPSQPLDELKFTTRGKRPGMAVLDDGTLVPFESLDGFPVGTEDRVVAVALERHVLEVGP